MSNIYVVTTGEYSDYCIRGIFSSPELAEAFKATFSYEANEGETYILDEYRNLLEHGYRPYQVVIDKEGQVKRILENTGVGREFAEKNTSIWFFPKDNSRFLTQYAPNFLDCMRLNTLAKSEEHAIKIANDHRAIAVALNQWGKMYEACACDECKTFKEEYA